MGRRDKGSHVPSPKPLRSSLKKSSKQARDKVKMKGERKGPREDLKDPASPRRPLGPPFLVCLCGHMSRAVGSDSWPQCKISPHSAQWYYHEKWDAHAHLGSYTPFLCWEVIKSQGKCQKVFPKLLSCCQMIILSNLGNQVVFSFFQQ